MCSDSHTVTSVHDRSSAQPPRTINIHDQARNFSPHVPSSGCCIAAVTLILPFPGEEELQQLTELCIARRIYTQRMTIPTDRSFDLS